MRAILPVFGTVTAVTLVSVLVVYGMGLRVYRDNAACFQSRQVIESLEDTLSTLKDAETGQHGFLLTGDEKYLDTYNAAKGRLRADLNQLEQWAKGGDISSEAVASVGRLTQAKLEDVQQTIQLRREKGPDAALAVVRADPDKPLMDQLRRQIARMEAQETEKFDRRWRKRNMDNVLRTLVTVAMGLVTLGFLLWAFRRIQRGMAGLEQQRQLLAVTLASIGDGVIVTDAQGRVTFLNGEAERLTGWPNAEATGQPLPAVFKIINEQTRQAVESPVDKVLRLGAIVGLANHTVLIAKDGRETPIDDSGAPIRQRDGSVQGVVLVFRDFSEPKAAEKVLRERETHFRAIFDHAGVGIIEAGTDDHFIAANDRVCQILGYQREELLRLNVHELTYPEDRPRSDELNAELRTGRCERIDYEKRYLKRDGVPLWVHVTVSAIQDSAGRRVRFIATVEDISQRKAAEQALRASEERYRSLFESMDEGFALCEMTFDEAGQAEGWRYLEVNPAFAKLTGLPVEQVAGRHVREVIPSIEASWVETYGRVVRSGESVRLVSQVGELGRHYEVYAYRTTPGRFAAIFSDVTARKQAEEGMAAAKISAERARTAAEEANKAKDHFLAVLSHELRTPLTPVLTTASMLGHDTQMPERYRDDIEMIRRNVELEARLIDDLLDVTRITRGKVELDRKPVALSAVIHRAVEVCKADIEGRQLHFGVEFLGETASCIIEADIARLQQVFWNLLKNAIKFTPHGGCVGIRCRPDGGGFVITEVNDSGEGIDPAVLPRLFNAFEQGGARVTRQFGGLGLGLTITKGLVEMHGGTISAHSGGKGKGASFRVRLPIARAAQGGAAESRDPMRVAAGADSRGAPRALRILLVEDHGDTAKIMRRILMADGHQVQTAGDVATALELADTQPFDLLLSDLGLPDGSGIDLMRKLRQKGHTLPGIALSGYGQEQDIQRSREAGFAMHLTKPISLERLAEAIAGVTG